MTCRHQDTGKPRGFAFLAYEDQRSTVLAVDNLNGCRVSTPSTFKCKSVFPCIAERWAPVACVTLELFPHSRAINYETFVISGPGYRR